MGALNRQRQEERAHWCRARWADFWVGRRKQVTLADQAEVAGAWIGGLGPPSQGTANSAAWNNKNLFSQSSRGQESKIRVSEGWVPAFLLPSAGSWQLLCSLAWGCTIPVSASHPHTALISLRFCYPPSSSSLPSPPFDFLLLFSGLIFWFRTCPNPEWPHLKILTSTKTLFPISYILRFIFLQGHNSGLNTTPLTQMYNFKNKFPGNSLAVQRLGLTAEDPGSVPWSGN